MKHYLKKIVAFGTALAVSIISTSCGITEYETVHDCGTYTIATFEDLDKLAFAEHTPMKTVAKAFTDFCYYKGESSIDTPYVAHVPVDMSAFFESEVIIRKYGSSDEDNKEIPFPEYVEAEKERKGDDYEDIGNGSHSELYLYFNADKELSMWQLCPDVEYYSYNDIFAPTFNKNYILLDYDLEEKTIPIESPLTGNTLNWPYLACTFYFSFNEGILTVYSRQEDYELNDKTSYIKYTP